MQGRVSVFPLPPCVCECEMFSVLPAILSSLLRFSLAVKRLQLIRETSVLVGNTVVYSECSLCLQS